MTLPARPVLPDQATAIDVLVVGLPVALLGLEKPSLDKARVGRQLRRRFCTVTA